MSLRQIEWYTREAAEKIIRRHVTALFQLKYELSESTKLVLRLNRLLQRQRLLLSVSVLANLVFAVLVLIGDRL